MSGSLATQTDPEFPSLQLDSFDNAGYFLVTVDGQESFSYKIDFDSSDWLVWGRGIALDPETEALVIVPPNRNRLFFQEELDSFVSVQTRACSYLETTLQFLEAKRGVCTDDEKLLHIDILLSAGRIRLNCERRRLLVLIRLAWRVRRRRLLRSVFKIFEHFFFMNGDGRPPSTPSVAWTESWSGRGMILT
jgi:hypothetical protein